MGSCPTGMGETHRNGRRKGRGSCGSAEVPVLCLHLSLELSKLPKVLPGNLPQHAEPGPMEKGRAIKITGPLPQVQGHLPTTHHGSRGGSAEQSVGSQTQTPVSSRMEGLDGKAGKPQAALPSRPSPLPKMPFLSTWPDLLRLLSAWPTPHPFGLITNITSF